MASVSDIIEEFILSTMAQSDVIEICRNDLAKYFSCVPSQINYVLNTRFTLNRGYVVESTRGGAGHVKVIKLENKGDNHLKHLLEMCKQPMNFLEGSQVLENLHSKDYLTDSELNLLNRAISAKSLNNPLNMDEVLRANILKEVILELMKAKK